MSSAQDYGLWGLGLTLFQRVSVDSMGQTGTFCTVGIPMVLKGISKSDDFMRSSIQNSFLFHLVSLTGSLEIVLLGLRCQSLGY